MEIIWEHSVWLIGPALGIAAILSLWMYRKDKRLEGASSLLLLALRFFRFSAIAFLLILLLEPYVRRVLVEKEKPLLAVVVDQSRSMMLSKDSSQVLNLKSNLDQLIRELDNDFDVELVGFGSQLSNEWSADFNERSTSYTDLYIGLEDRYRNRPLRGIVLASDGIATRSYYPDFENLSVPIFPIAVGDTTVRRDAFINKSRSNATAFLGNSFPLEVSVQAHAMNGEELVIDLFEDGVLIESATFVSNSFKDSESLRFQVEAIEEGVHSYVFEIREVEGDISSENNRKQILVTVVDRKQEVIIVGSAPHPDMGAIRLALEGSEQFTVSSYTNADPLPIGSEYALIVAHNYGSLNQEWRSFIDESRKSTWFISEPKDDHLLLSTAQNVVSVSIEDSKGDKVRAHVDESFVLFEVSPELEGLLKQLPPLSVPFGIYTSSNGSNHLLFQMLGSVETDRPLLSFGSSSARKIAIMPASGIWRWRLVEHGINGNQELINSLIRKIAVYLASDRNTKPLQLINESIFNEGDPIRIRAELFNESNERITGPEVELNLRDEQGSEYSFVMSRKGNYYELRQSNLPPGSYEINAQAVLGNKTLTDVSGFEIREVLEEVRNLRANHAVLKSWADNSGGALINIGQLDELSNLVKENTDSAASLYEESSLDPLVELRWLLLIPIVLLGLEWVIRKWAGTY